MIPLHLIAAFGLALPALAQVQNFKPVTQPMLENPSPDDWLMFSRTWRRAAVQPVETN